MGAIGRFDWLGRILARRSLADSLPLFLCSVKSGIDFEKIESNEHNIYVLVGYQVDIDGAKKQAKVITLILPVFFFPDVLELEAELWTDRRGVFIKVPSVPSALYKHPENVLAVMAGAEGATGVCKSTKQTYKTESTRIASSQRDQFKIISVAFPDGVKCNNREFNEGAEGDCDLKTHFGTMTATHPLFKKGKKLLQFPFSFGFWRIIVDGTAKQAEIKTPKDRSQLINQLIGGVSHLNLSSGTSLTVMFHLRCIVDLL